MAASNINDVKTLSTEVKSVIHDMDPTFAFSILHNVANDSCGYGINIHVLSNGQAFPCALEKNSAADLGQKITLKNYCTNYQYATGNKS